MSKENRGHYATAARMPQLPCVGPFLDDWIPRADLDFPDLLTSDPELMAKNIGLQPEAFVDFEFRKAEAAGK